jgi:hypothetical protein
MKRLIALSLALLGLALVSLIAINSSSLKGIDRVVLAKTSTGTTQPSSPPPPQIITICKKTVPAGGSGFPFLRANGAGSLPSFTLNDGQCNSMNLSGQDHYNKFTENIPAGWTLTNIACTYTTAAVKIIGANANPAFQPGDNTVTIDLNEPNVTCTFYNRQNPCCTWGRNLSTGQSGPADPIWNVNNGNAYVTTPVSSWIALNPAKWIQFKNSPNPASVAGPIPIYKYKVTFTVPSCPTGHVELHGVFAADNSAQALLDGNAVPGASCPGPVCFNTPQAPVPLNVALILPGVHTLEIDVTNNSYGASGLIVRAQLSTVCP